MCDAPWQRLDGLRNHGGRVRGHSTRRPLVQTDIQDPVLICESIVFPVEGQADCPADFSAPSLEQVQTRSAAIGMSCGPVERMACQLLAKAADGVRCCRHCCGPASRPVPASQAQRPARHLQTGPENARRSGTRGATRAASASTRSSMTRRPASRCSSTPSSSCKSSTSSTAARSATSTTSSRASTARPSFSASSSLPLRCRSSSCRRPCRPSLTSRPSTARPHCFRARPPRAARLLALCVAGTFVAARAHPPRECAASVLAAALLR